MGSRVQFPLTLLFILIFVSPLCPALGEPPKEITNTSAEAEDLLPFTREEIIPKLVEVRKTVIELHRFLKARARRVDERGSTDRALTRYELSVVPQEATNLFDGIQKQ